MSRYRAIVGRTILAVSILLILSACIGETEKTPTAHPTSTPIPDVAAKPTATLTATPQPLSGTTRKNPLPSGSSITVKDLVLSVKQAVRGEDAWQLIHSANPFNEPAPDGKEYLLLNLNVKNTGSGDALTDIADFFFSVTGDNLQKYSSGGAAAPEPVLDGGLFPGGELSGWKVFIIKANEHNLLLNVSGLYGDDAPTQYLALEEGASIATDPMLASLLPTDNGLSRSTPASIGELIRTGDWELTVNSVLRGEKAWEQIIAANQFNDPPTDGMEYMLANLTLRYIGSDDEGAAFSSGYFSTTGSKNVLYDTPSIVEPEPDIGATLFPGGSVTGWLALQIGENEDNRLLIIDAQFGKDRRFVKLSE